MILQEAHNSPYSIHPGNTKMYMDMKERFWWNNLKRDIAEHIALCDVCSRVKASIRNQQVCFNHYLFLIGSGTRLVWISLPDYQGPGQDMILFG